MQPHEFIDGFQQVITRFGQWSSFHDGEVHRIVLDRTAHSPNSSDIPSVEIHLQGWVMGPELTNEGFFEQRNDSVVQFLFEDIFDFELVGFNQQNVLPSLNLSLIEHPNGSGHDLHIAA